MTKSIRKVLLLMKTFPKEIVFELRNEQKHLKSFALPRAREASDQSRSDELRPAKEAAVATALLVCLFVRLFGCGAHPALFF